MGRKTFCALCRPFDNRLDYITRIAQKLSVTSAITVWM